MKNCKLCNSEIPNWIKIDNKRYNLMNRKFCLTCSPHKKHNTKNLANPKPTEISKDGITYRKCSKCQSYLQLNSENYYISQNGHIHSQCKKCNGQSSIDNQRKAKIKCVEYKGGKCVICGYNRCVSSLDFHHVDPTLKDFNISEYKTFSFEKLKIELDKCVCVCRNCHGEIHSGMIETFRS